MVMHFLICQSNGNGNVMHSQVMHFLHYFIITFALHSQMNETRHMLSTLTHFIKYVIK